MREGDVAPDGAYIDDRSLASLEHLWQHRQGRMQGAEEVDVHGLVEAIQRLALQRTNHDDAGIVDQDVDATEMRGSRGDHFPRFSLYAHVAGVNPYIRRPHAVTRQPPTPPCLSTLALPSIRAADARPHTSGRPCLTARPTILPNSD